MRVAIAGAGSVGRSIAAELTGSGHEVLLIDRDTRAIGVDELPRAEWLLADACELSSLEDANLGSFDVLVAASSDDKVNLVVALLAKTEFDVPWVIARINEPANEWLFTESWGVDVALSPPRLLAGLVEDFAEAERSAEPGAEAPLPGADLAESVLSEDSPYAGRPARDLCADLPEGAALVAIVDGSGVRPPDQGRVLAAGETLVFLAGAESMDGLEGLLDRS